jgi:hypothetical protein
LSEDNPQSKQVIKPLVVGKNIRKWKIDFKNQYILYMYHGIDINELDAVINYLKPYRQKLEKRATKQQWYELQQPQKKYSLTFNRPKIVFPDIAKELRFTLDLDGFYVNDTTFIIPLHDLYLLAILNSTTTKTFILQLSPQILGKSLRFKRQYVEQIPIPLASNSEKEAISKLVQKCLDAKGVDCEAWEKEIDDRVAALYGL